MFIPQDFFKYYRDCFKLDYKEFNVDNILSQKYPYKWFVSEDEELVTEALPYIPFTNKNIEHLEKDIELYRLEKKLFYGCFFILGKTTNPLIKDKRVCAPLLLFPAKIVTELDEKFLEVDKGELLINRSILSKLELKDSTLNKDEFLQKLSELVNQQNFIELGALIDKYFINLISEELVIHPKVWPVSKIRKYLSNINLEEGMFKIVPSAGTVFVDKTESTLKVINDLNGIVQQNTFNNSLEELFNTSTKENQFHESLYNIRLNFGQSKSLENAYKYNNSAIVGPPGTGKSYTITSIIADHVVNNKSVLVVSKTKQAVEVLRSMLEDDFQLKNYLIHTTGNNYKKSLKAKVRKYLSGNFSKKRPLDETIIYKNFESINLLQKEFDKQVDYELEKSKLDFSNSLSLTDKIKKLYLNSFLFKNHKLWEVFEEIQNRSERFETKINSWSKRKIHSNILKNSKSFRKDIATFYDALDSTSFTEYKQLLQDVQYSNILKVFPIWLVNLTDLNSVLPLQKDLFDLVIIDEATQCDISTALPAIFRAKKTVIVGDPNQLRHYSFISKKQQNDLLHKYNLPLDKIFDYRNRSILDLYISKIIDQEQVSFLREHFRSTPSLIEFSNQKFYEGNLEIIKSTPKHTNHSQIEMIELDGQRDNKGINEVEANAIIEKIKTIIDQYKNFPSPSIGIISPFSTQVNYINKLLKEHFPLEDLKMFNMLCGTPYQFQGTEREIILLSFCVSDDSHHSAYAHINKPEVLNVAITRAKSYQYVYNSTSEKAANKESLLFDYFRFIKSFSYGQEQTIEEDEFQNEVVEALKNKVDEIKCSYPIAGSLLDILVIHQGKNYFIDLIGYPGMFLDAFSIERYKTLGRTGIRCFPLPYSYWKRDKEQAINRLLMFIKK